MKSEWKIYKYYKSWMDIRMCLHNSLDKAAMLNDRSWERKFSADNNFFHGFLTVSIFPQENKLIISLSQNNKHYL